MHIVNAHKSMHILKLIYAHDMHTPALVHVHAGSPWHFDTATLAEQDMIHRQCHDCDDASGGTIGKEDNWAAMQER